MPVTSRVSDCTKSNNPPSSSSSSFFSTFIPPVHPIALSFVLPLQHLYIFASCNRQASHQSLSPPYPCCCRKPIIAPQTLSTSILHSMPARYYGAQSQDYSLVDNPNAAHPATEAHDEDYDDLSHYSNYRYEEPHPAQPSYADERGMSPPPASARNVSNPFTDHARTASPAPSFPRGGAYPAAAEGYSSDYNDLKSGPRPTKKAPLLSQWSRKKKLIVFGGIAAAIIVIAIAVGVGISLSKGSYNYVPEWNQVQNATSFETGGATRRNVNETNDGIGAGEDKYTYYQGGPENFPSSGGWVSFEDMWDANKPIMLQACGWLKMGAETTEKQTQYIYDAIQDRANASLVDHRFILAIIMQESHGCVNVHHTTSSSGVKNPGLMQSHEGHAFDSDFARLSIYQMVQDGTQGTDAAAGYGLVQNLDLYGDPYSAARGYNSGYIPKSGDLSEASGATACYVSDVANRLTGWVSAKNLCEEGS